MNDQTDSQLLRAYVEHRAEPAFTELVRRHLDIVHSAALRMVCDSHLAQDVTQGVFVALASNAAQLKERPVLSGWLHRTAQNIAAQTVRTDVRRRVREQEAAAMNELLSAEPDVVWEHIAPHLDSALGELTEADRDALMLRYFERKSAGEMAATLGISDEAAQKRVSRAVERLREFFARRGITVGASGLVLVISANAAQAAPMGLAATITAVAVAQGATASGSIMTFAKGLLKPAFTSSAGIFIPILGSVIFTLKAEIEHAKSPRERRLIARMIWLRFTAALLSMAVLLVIGVTKPAFVKKPGVIEFGFSGFFFIGAVEVAARTVYFHRRRRQIQMEDGTWEEFDLGKPTGPGQLLADLSDKSSKANRYAAIAAVFGLIGCLVATMILMKHMMAEGHWIAAVLILFLVGLRGSFRWIRNWRQRSRQVFNAGFGKLAKTMVAFAVMSLVFFDISWARGRLPLSNEWAVGFNILVVLAYAMLITILAQMHRPLAGPSDTTTTQ